MAVSMDSVDAISIPEGDVRVIRDGNGPIWYRQDTVTIDLLPYVQDNVGWWNVSWSTCAGFGADTNWSFGTTWFPVGEGKLQYKLYLHSSVGHLTAWDASGAQLGYINGSNSGSMRESEWVLPTGTKWLRICIAYPQGGIGQGKDQYVRYIGKPPIPRRYQMLPYITSTGTQYIDTGLTPDANHVIDMWMTPTEPTGDSKFFGMYGGDIKGAFLGCYNNKWRIGSTLKSSSVPITGDRIRVRNQGSSWQWGSVLDGDPSESCTAIATGNNTYLLFASRFGGTGQPPIQFGKMKCHILRIGLRQNSSYPLVMAKPQLCLIPCRDLSTNELGMYDTVSGAFKGNLGTGTFAA